MAAKLPWTSKKQNRKIIGASDSPILMEKTPENSMNIKENKQMDDRKKAT